MKGVNGCTVSSTSTTILGMNIVQSPSQLCGDCHALTCSRRPGINMAETRLHQKCTRHSLWLWRRGRRPACASCNGLWQQPGQYKYSRTHQEHQRPPGVWLAPAMILPVCLLVSFFIRICNLQSLSVDPWLTGNRLGMGFFHYRYLGRGFSPSCNVNAKALTWDESLNWSWNAIKTDHWKIDMLPKLWGRKFMINVKLYKGCILLCLGWWAQGWWSPPPSEENRCTIWTFSII